MDIYGNLSIPSAKLQDVMKAAKDWAYSHGVVMKNNANRKVCNHAPFTLLPTPFPAYLYNEAMEIQKDFQLLYHRASQDHEFIETALKSVMIHDEFIKKQFEIFKKVRAEGIKQKICFSISRSDYMIDEVKENFDSSSQLQDVRPHEIKQIEMNLVACSLSGLISSLPEMHRYIADEFGEQSPFQKEKIATQIPLKNLGLGMAKAFQAYGNNDAIVVFVVSDDGQNTYDQRKLQYSFQEGVKSLGVEKHVRCLFRDLQTIHANAELRDGNKLFVEKQEVAICYFRSGYTPSCFKIQDILDVRLLIERSCCIKCPTLGEQLVGTKKIQQVMATPGVVERFIDDEEAVKRIRRTFAGLYSLDPGKDGDEAARKALLEPSRYVMKPQREGGGNNLYDDDLVAELKRVEGDPVERSQYILMERIKPPVVKNYIVHYDKDAPSFVDTTTELGFFGVYIRNAVNVLPIIRRSTDRTKPGSKGVGRDDGKEILNESSGHLLITKSIEHKDGGVNAGRSVLDTPYLY